MPQLQNAGCDTAISACRRRLPGAYDNVYYVGDGEEVDLLVPTIAATTIMVLPLLLVGLKVLQKAM